jgi:hypothetical protein
VRVAVPVPERPGVMGMSGLGMLVVVLTGHWPRIVPSTDPGATTTTRSS